MNNLREIWGNRFVHYMTEFQRYMKFVFTGHLAIVLVFTIGAGGFAYSEWLKEVPADFSALQIPFIVMATDLHGRQEAALSSGPLYPALAAPMSLSASMCSGSRPPSATTCPARGKASIRRC